MILINRAPPTCSDRPTPRLAEPALHTGDPPFADFRPWHPPRERSARSRLVSRGPGRSAEGVNQPSCRVNRGPVRVVYSLPGRR